MNQEVLGVLIGIVHFGTAIAVTLHVLMTKRDIGASISWIGVAWLSPVIGSLLYLMLGINRVRRRALRLHRRRAETSPREPVRHVAGEQGALAPLHIAAGRISGRPTEPGNAITLLSQGDEAYPEMLAAIEAAGTSIALSTYIFRADALGQRFIEALANAHRRGVQIRVLIDGVGGGYFLSPAYHRLRGQGIPAARFLHSPAPWRMPFLNMRTHKKILVLDGRIAFTGGLNIGAENVLKGRPRDPVRDTHFRLTGPVVAQLSEAFAADWQFTTGEVLFGPRWFPELPPDGYATARTITSGPDHDIEKLELVLLTAIETARRTIRIMTPYFLPDERLCSVLALAALRGVGVDIVIPRHSNHPVVDWASRAQIRPLLVAGCRIWQSPPPFDHSKLMTIDNAWSLVGSANWDVRSLRLNFELDLEIYDESFARLLDGRIEHYLDSKITLAQLDKRSILIRLRDAAARLMLPYL